MDIKMVFFISLSMATVGLNADWLPFEKYAQKEVFTFLNKIKGEIKTRKDFQDLAEVSLLLKNAGKGIAIFFGFLTIFDLVQTIKFAISKDSQTNKSSLGILRSVIKILITKGLITPISLYLYSFGTLLHNQAPSALTISEDQTTFTLKASNIGEFFYTVLLNSLYIISPTIKT